MSKKIVITVVTGGNPVIEMGGEDVEIQNANLSYLSDEINRLVHETHGLGNNLISISALGGEIVRHGRVAPAKSLRQVVSFRDIILHKTSGNTREQHLVDRVFPVLACLFWQQSEHFKRVGEKYIFECTMCGYPHFPIHKTNSAHPEPPTVCEFGKCYSHQISQMFKPEHEAGKKNP